MISLREYQEAGVAQIRDSFRRGRRAPLYQLATGGGKGVILTYVAKGAAEKGNRVWILTHRRELIAQIEAHLFNQGIPHGVIAAGRKMDQSKPVQVASVQTLINRLDKLPDPNLIICDESHHVCSNTWAHILTYHGKSLRLGVTATPIRLSGEGLCDYFDDLICGPSMQTLIDQKFLATPTYYAPPSGVNTDKLHIVAGDFNKHEVELLVDRPSVTGNVVETYQRIGKNKPALIFGASLKHCENLAAEFRLFGYKAEMIDGKMDDTTRLKHTKGIADGSIQVLVSCEIINEGFDVIGAKYAGLCRPTASLGLHLQQGGRVLRPSPNDMEAIVADHVGNVLRHGFFEEPREWSLAGQPKKKQAAEKVFPNRVCPQCFRTHAWALACPQCGHVYPIESRDIRQTDGTLEQITAAEVARVRARQEVGRAESLEALIAIGKARGYKPTWAYIQWKHRRWRKTAKVAGVQEDISI